jgi:hypothetical protein
MFSMQLGTAGMHIQIGKETAKHHSCQGGNAATSDLKGTTGWLNNIRESYEGIGLFKADDGAYCKPGTGVQCLQESHRSFDKR